MKLVGELSEFNRRMAEELLMTFPPNVKPVQSEDGTLLFRGPIPLLDDPKHVGTHVAVSLDSEVCAALDAASKVDREEMIANLIASLGTQVKEQYAPNKIGLDALDVVGTMRMLRG